MVKTGQSEKYYLRGELKNIGPLSLPLNFGWLNRLCGPPRLFSIVTSPYEQTSKGGRRLMVNVNIVRIKSDQTIV